jgi:predicted RNA binding protein YcfA (HicA-like mRNA interferase family)
MGRLGNISGKEAAAAFARAGWQAIGQVGSHLVMTKPGHRANLSVPQHKELSVGTLRALIRNAEMSVDEFLSLLGK